jgi:hypothetical protein
MPQLSCPRCKRPMRLVSMEPTAGREENKMRFACDCGFECWLTEEDVVR